MKKPLKRMKIEKKIDDKPMAASSVGMAELTIKTYAQISTIARTEERERARERERERERDIMTSMWLRGIPKR
jgi:hypothetical protein